MENMCNNDCVDMCIPILASDKPRPLRLIGVNVKRGYVANRISVIRTMELHSRREASGQLSMEATEGVNGFKSFKIAGVVLLRSSVASPNSDDWTPFFGHFDCNLSFKTNCPNMTHIRAYAAPTKRGRA
jgi:hypothetical protein